MSPRVGMSQCASMAAICTRPDCVGCHANMTENNALVGVDYRALADELAAALEGLYNEQNGPPLLGPNHEPYYAAAIAKTDAALAKYRAAKGEGNE